MSTIPDDYLSKLSKESSSIALKYAILRVEPVATKRLFMYGPKSMTYPSSNILNWIAILPQTFWDNRKINDLLEVVQTIQKYIDISSSQVKIIAKALYDCESICEGKKLGVEILKSCEEDDWVNIDVSHTK